MGQRCDRGESLRDEIGGGSVLLGRAASMKAAKDEAMSMVDG